MQRIGERETRKWGQLEGTSFQEGCLVSEKRSSGQEAGKRGNIERKAEGPDGRTQIGDRADELDLKRGEKLKIQVCGTL